MINERYITSKGSEIMMMIIIILKDNEKNKKNHVTGIVISRYVISRNTSQSA